MEQQRNSPLNLEQRSSPLNLTSVQVSGRPNKGLPSYHYQTDFGFSSDANGSSFQQQQQTVNYTYYSQVRTVTETVTTNFFLKLLI
jgi:hypothetical protein